MPYQSRAQQRKFHALEARGEIDPKTVAEFDKATNFKHLPERVKSPKKSTRELFREGTVKALKKSTRGSQSVELSPRSHTRFSLCVLHLLGGVGAGGVFLDGRQIAERAGGWDWLDAHTLMGPADHEGPPPW